MMRFLVLRSERNSYVAPVDCTRAAEGKMRDLPRYAEWSSNSGLKGGLAETCNVLKANSSGTPFP